MRSALGLSFLAIALTSVLLLVSNLGVRLPVYFLTLQTRPQPLGLWFVLAIAAGLLTSAVIHLLIRSISHTVIPAAAAGASSPSSEPRSRRRSDWTFMGRESVRQRTNTAPPPSEPWESAEADWSARRQREPEPAPRSPRPESPSAAPSERVIDTGFRVVKPSTKTAAEPRSSSPPPRSPASSGNDNDWDFIEQDDW